MTKLGSYLNGSSLLDPDEGVDDWNAEFRASAVATDALNGADYFTDANTYYNAVHEWFSDGGGARYRNSIKWKDTTCNNDTAWDTCDPTKGINGTRMGATIKLEHTATGQMRYGTMMQMRGDIEDIFLWRMACPLPSPSPCSSSTGRRWA